MMGNSTISGLRRQLVVAVAMGLLGVIGLLAITNQQTYAQSPPENPSERAMRIQLLQPPPLELPPASELLGTTVTVFVGGVECGVIQVPGGEADNQRGAIIAAIEIGSDTGPSECRVEGAPITFINGYGHELFERTTFEFRGVYLLQNLAPVAYASTGPSTVEGLSSIGSQNSSGGLAAAELGLLSAAAVFLAIVASRKLRVPRPW